MSDARYRIVQLLVIITGIIFLVKLFSIQVSDKNYARAAENNIILPIVEYPFRGLMFDRNDQLIVFNTPEFDLTVTPSEVRNLDTLALCQLLGITLDDFSEKMKSARAYAWVKPSVFMKQLSNSEFASIQDQLVDFPGFRIRARTARAYSQPVLSNALGYISEISKEQLDVDSGQYYRQGDYIGKSGLEDYYEKQLRGQRGVKYKMVNVKGVEKGAFKEGIWDTLAVPGSNLKLTIDTDLQMYGQKLLDGKVGSVVAIEPASGEILSMISSPFYDPSLLSGRNFGSNFGTLQQDTLIPLFNRPIMAMYPPGSIFKIIQSLIGLEEGVIDPNEEVYVDGTLIGDHAPPGYYDLKKAIKLSSNNYFFKAFRKIINQNLDENTFIDSRLGLENWKDYIDRFGLGQPLGVDLPNEKGGQIPGGDFYDGVYGRNRWKFSTISSLSIGQGEILMNPLQMANLAAIMANRGYFYTPHLVKDAGYGESLLPYQEKHEIGIAAEHFDLVVDAMEEVITGTAWRAVVRDVAICGKTGTAENPHGADHSVFMAFAPKDDPQIAISVYVENAGWGGRAAASIASLMMEYYLKGEVERKWLEDYVLIGDFLDKEDEAEEEEQPEEVEITDDITVIRENE